MAYEILAKLDIAAEDVKRIIAITARELSYVGIAQMQDVYSAVARETPANEDILRLYLYKTGRYTFSLPLMIGGVLAGRPGAIVDLLGEVGGFLGIIFQIKDDELGLFGSEEDLGKPIGSDIREEKKTFYYTLLSRKASGGEAARLSGIFGKADLALEDIDFVRRLAIDLGIKREIDAMIESYAEKAESAISTLSQIAEPQRGRLLELLSFSLTRGR
jgi:geranylgeranyl diphosphate synthase type I